MMTFSAYAALPSYCVSFNEHRVYKQISNHIVHKIPGAKDKVSASGRAYSFSVPLLSAAYIGNPRLYDPLIIFMRTSMGFRADFDEMNPELTPSFGAWVLGRMVLSAMLMGDKGLVLPARNKLHNVLLGIKEADGYSAMAWSYLLIADAWNKSQYDTTKVSAFSAIKALEGKETEVANRIWALVTIAQAASYAQDKKTYAMVKEQIGVLANNNLQQGLALVPENDFRASMYATFYLASVNMHDEQMAAVLHDDVEQALITSSHRDDVILAQAIELQILRICKSL